MVHRLAERKLYDDEWDQNWWPDASHQIGPDGSEESSSIRSKGRHDYDSMFPTPTTWPFWTGTEGPPPGFPTARTAVSSPTSGHQYTQASELESPVPLNTFKTYVSGNKPYQTSTGYDSESTGTTSTQPSKHPPTAKIAAAVGIPLLVLGILGSILFFCLRKRKRERQKPAQYGGQQMKMRNDGTYPSAPFLAQPQYGEPSVPSPIPPPQPPAPIIPQPVILGPIPSGSNGAYYTGIDTSDVVSMPDTSGPVNPFGDQAEHLDDPPPPYRPRSLAPLSRDTSVRQAPSAAQSQVNLIQNAEQPGRSPFEDPTEDDAVSEISEPIEEHFAHHDSMSAVSDISYQEEPVVVRPSV